MPALLTRKSTLDTSVSISCAAERTEALELRSSLTKWVLMDGLALLIAAMTGAILDSVRRARMMVEGCAWAMLVASSAARLLMLGPVKTTVEC